MCICIASEAAAAIASFIWVRLTYMQRRDNSSSAPRCGISPDEISRRQQRVNFISTCYSSDCELIRFIIKHAVFCARAQSPIRRNYALCYMRYGSKVEDELKTCLKSSCCNYEALMQMSVTDNSHVSFALKLVMLRTGIFHTPGCEWSRVQIDCMLTAIGTR